MFPLKSIYFNRIIHLELDVVEELSKDVPHGLVFFYRLRFCFNKLSSINAHLRFLDVSKIRVKISLKLHNYRHFEQVCQREASRWFTSYVSRIMIVLFDGFVAHLQTLSCQFRIKQLATFSNAGGLKFFNSSEFIFVNWTRSNRQNHKLFF